MTRADIIPSGLKIVWFQSLFVTLFRACDRQEGEMEPATPSWPLQALAYKSKETQFLKLFSDDIKLELLFLVLTHENDQNWNIANYLFALSTASQSKSRIDNENLTMAKLPFTVGRLWFDAQNEWSDDSKPYYFFITFFETDRFFCLGRCRTAACYPCPA